jgi:hypothetical protein
LETFAHTDLFSLRNSLRMNLNMKKQRVKMNKTTSKKKLALNKETIAHLDVLNRKELREVKGAGCNLVGKTCGHCTTAM